MRRIIPVLLLLTGCNSMSEGETVACVFALLTIAWLDLTYRPPFEQRDEQEEDDSDDDDPSSGGGCPQEA